MSLDAVENARRRLLDVVHRLCKYVDVTVVELDVVGAVVERVKSKGATDDMGNRFGLGFANRFRRFLATFGVSVKPLVVWGCAVCSRKLL